MAIAIAKSIAINKNKRNYSILKFQNKIFFVLEICFFYKGFGFVIQIEKKILNLYTIQVVEKQHLVDLLQNLKIK